ncbi:hypothetical protein SLE2022_339210 [Rubroshorea leprosula]
MVLISWLSLALNELRRLGLVDLVRELDWTLVLASLQRNFSQMVANGEWWRKRCWAVGVVARDMLLEQYLALSLITLEMTVVGTGN